ncbi:hypothetical protein NH340_JMT05224 [Sarcoptes scabiei]|nr:hypothetical protein NH340_JMT05224 [Sarcoptes scabiei]
MSEEIEKKIHRITKSIRAFPDFPKVGVLFRDIFPIFADPNVLDDLIDVLINHIETNNLQLDNIVGLESRGFLLGSILGYRLKLPFIPIRKAGKLPGCVESIAYDLEYGSDRFEIQTESIRAGSKCLIIDDLLATGGSILSAIQLIKKCRASIAQVMVVIELEEFRGRSKFSEPFYSVIQY